MGLLQLPNELLLQIFEYNICHPWSWSALSITSKEDVGRCSFYNPLVRTSHRLRKIFMDYLLRPATWTLDSQHQYYFFRLLDITGRPELMHVISHPNNTTATAILKLRSGRNLRALSVEIHNWPCKRKRRQCVFNPDDSRWRQRERWALWHDWYAIRLLAHWPYPLHIKVAIRHEACCTEAKLWQVFHNEIKQLFHDVYPSRDEIFPNSNMFQHRLHLENPAGIGCSGCGIFTTCQQQSVIEA